MSVPQLRPGPPWVMEEMIAAQPRLAAALLGERSEAAAEIAAAIRAGGPVTVVGCGTSEHGAMAIAALLDEALGGGWPPAAASRQALDAAEHPQRGGVCIGVSHDGGTRATSLALAAAAAGGATTALITAAGVRPGDLVAGDDRPAPAIVLRTPLHDDSWCHTVGYTSPILAGAAVARELGLEGVDAGAAEALLRAAPDPPSLAGAERVVCAGAGVDLITARELALKLAEGARVPTAALHLETLLHGHLAGEDASTAAVLVDSGGSARVDRRGELAAAALREIGMPVHRLEIERGSTLERLLAGAVALQHTTLALARARAVNPDLIRREEEVYRRAGEAAEGGDW